MKFTYVYKTVTIEWTPLEDGTWKKVETRPQSKGVTIQTRTAMIEDLFQVIADSTREQVKEFKEQRERRVRENHMGGDS